MDNYKRQQDKMQVSEADKTDETRYGQLQKTAR